MLARLIRRVSGRKHTRLRRLPKKAHSCLGPYSLQQVSLNRQNHRLMNAFHDKTEPQCNKRKILTTAQYENSRGLDMKLLRLWIEGLDEMLGGGLPEKSVVLMTGEPGSGYDILAQQILYQHALHNEKASYFTTSRSTDAIKEDLGTFGWNVTPFEEQGNWIFHDASTTKTIQTLPQEIPQAVSNGHWTLIDSLSYLILTQGYLSVIKTLEIVVESARKHGGLHFLLLTQKMHGTETETTMQHLADGVIEFTAQETTGGIDRRIRIKKMRKAVCEPRLIPFNITERGITIETAVRIA